MSMEVIERDDIDVYVSCGVIRRRQGIGNSMPGRDHSGGHRKHGQSFRIDMFHALPVERNECCAEKKRNRLWPLSLTGVGGASLDSLLRGIDSGIETNCTYVAFPDARHRQAKRTATFLL
jgi:hypothetical protein